MASRGKKTLSIILVGGVLFGFYFSINAQLFLKANFPTNIFLLEDENKSKLFVKTTDVYQKETINKLLDHNLYVFARGEVILSSNIYGILLNDSYISGSRHRSIPKCGIIVESLNDMNQFVGKDIFLMNIHIIEIYNIESNYWQKITNFNYYQIKGITIGVNICFFLLTTLFYSINFKRKKIMEKIKEEEPIIAVPK